MNTTDGVQRLEARPTGATLVYFRDDCPPDACCDCVNRRFGREPLRSRDIEDMAHLALSLRRDGGVFFDEFNIAVIEPTRFGVEPSIFEQMRQDAEVRLLRPEYFVDAMGDLFGRFSSEGAAGDPQRAASANAARGSAGAGASVARVADGAAPAPRSAAPAADEHTTTWGLRAIGADASPYTGAGIKVAVLDTGFDVAHPDFSDRVIEWASFIDGEDPRDGQGHGSHVAGTAVGPRVGAPGRPGFGVAPEALLYAGKVLGDDGSGREGDILAGILWAIRSNCEVICLSLGRPAMPGDDRSDYEQVGRVALDRGCLIVAAAGNDSDRAIDIIYPVSAPANAPSIMAVGAVDEDARIARFSNGGLQPNGGEINVIGPGVDVFSLAPGGGYRTISGTSMAAPHVAGTAALFAQSDANLRGRALWAALESAARDVGVEVSAGGKGLVQAPKGPAGVA